MVCISALMKKEIAKKDQKREAERDFKMKLR